MFLLVACVDKSFRLDEASLEVTIGNESTTTLPLGFIEEKYLGDMINSEELDGLEMNEDGTYSLNYAGEEEHIEIKGITKTFDIPETSTSFMVTYPSFDMGATSVELHEAPTVAMDIDKYNIGGNQYYIPDNISVPISGAFHDSCVMESIHFDVPEQIADIKYILLEGGQYGAPIRASLDFNSLSAINDGGTILFDIALSGANFTLRDENGEVCVGNTFQREYQFESGEQDITFEIYIEKIDDLAEINNGVLDIPIEFEYNLEFNMNTHGGTFSLDSLPTLSFDAVLDYKDADVELNGESPIIEYHEKDGNKITISGLPKEINSISRITLEEDMAVTLYAHGLEWLEELADMVEVEIILPNYLVLHSLPDVEYSYNENSHLLHTSLADLSDGMVLGIEAIDFSDNKIIPENGAIEIIFAPDIVAHFTDHSEVFVSSLLENNGKDIAFETGLEGVTLDVLSVSGEIAYCEVYNKTIDLKDLKSDIDIKIEGTGLSPIISMNISNPLTLAADINAQIVPVSDNTANNDNTITISNVPIAPAIYNNGEIINGETHLIIADESRREAFTDEKYTFVACEIDSLLAGTLPDSINLILQITTNGNEVSNIYITEQGYFTYDYDIDIPMAFNDNLNISFSDKIDNLSEVLKEVTKYDITVGDVAIIADITNTTPLKFNGKAEILDKEGKPSNIQVSFSNGEFAINGSKDGISEALSQVRMNFDIPNGDIRSLAEVDGISFTLQAQGVSENTIPLNNQQYISAKLKLELTGGVTIDLESLKK